MYKILISIICLTTMASTIHCLFTTTQITYTKVKEVYGLNQEGQGSVVFSLIACAKLCMKLGCTEFAGKALQSEEEGHLCSISTDQGHLTKGLWDIYRIDCQYPETITFLKRTDDTTDFDRMRSDYIDGFGDEKNFWLGLDKLYEVTNSGNFGVIAKMTTWDGNAFWAYYSSFSVGPQSDNYQLSVSGYDPDSTAGDGLSYHSGREFTTKDADHDSYSGGSCSVSARGGWWYGHCTACNPTGLYLYGGVVEYQGITWYYTPGYNDRYSYKEMSLILISRQVC